MQLYDYRKRLYLINLKWIHRVCENYLNLWFLKTFLITKNVSPKNKNLIWN